MLFAFTFLAGACAYPTDPSGNVPDLRGSWDLTGERVAPALSLTGTLEVSGQEGDLIVGTIQWEESDGMGGVALGGGAVSGRVLGDSDVDFETLPGGSPTRRFVGALVADTLTGTWLDLPAGGASGTFRLVRDTP